MNAEVSGGGEREKSEGESKEAQFTHMVLVSGVQLKDNVVWNKLYISQFEGIFKTLMPATERSLSAISYMDNTHCAAEINVRERQWKTGMVTEWKSTGFNWSVINTQGKKECLWISYNFTISTF